MMQTYGRLAQAAVQEEATDASAFAAMFADHVIASSPAGVMSGRNDEDFAASIADGFAHYREIGATRFEIVALRIEVLDEIHALAHVGWEFDYRRPADGFTGTIAFTNIYAVSAAGGEPRIFAWMTPDEQKALREHGLA